MKPTCTGSVMDPATNTMQPCQNMAAHFYRCGSYKGYLCDSCLEGMKGFAERYRHPLQSKPLGNTCELGCCCCGLGTRGRQWHNRDTHYGMCVECIAFVRKQGMSESEILNNYGVEGIHWGVEPT